MTLKIHVSLGVLLTLVAMSVALNGAEAEAVTYYVQLVRATADSKPPASDIKPIGSKIARTICPAFKWSHYWEMNRQEVRIVRGSKAMVKLGVQRAVEIDLTGPGHRKITAFEGKSPLSTIVNPVGGMMTIIGGDRTTNSSWFIVVRRDKPAT